MCLLLAPATVFACDECRKNKPAPGRRVVEYDLRIAEHIQSPAGRPVRVLAINGRIPGPVLRFREGDFARIRVHNDLRNEETSTHWHGLAAGKLLLRGPGRVGPGRGAETG